MGDAELRALTEAPRQYGFHGTFKAPFRLADGADVQHLHAALSTFARRQASFALRGLRLRAIGEFLALVPSEDSPPLSRLAEACVTEFDAFRAPPEPADLAKRHAAGLTPRQTELLARWGYPYVMDEFRFHLTLTASIPDEASRVRLSLLITSLAAPILKQPALYELDRDNRLPPDGRIIAVSRGDMSHEAFIKLVEESCVEFSTKGKPLDSNVWARFSRRLKTVLERSRSTILPASRNGGAPR